jgi:folate-binding protein YgfZ
MIEQEYQAVREGGVGILEVLQHGLIEVSGGEAVQFLNGLVTNDVAKLADNSWMMAAFPNAQGRLLALVRVVRRGDRFLFVTEPENYEKILQNLMRFTFAGDFKVEDLTEKLRLVRVRGNDLEKLGLPIPDDNTVQELDFNNGKITVWQAFRERGFDALIDKSAAETEFLPYFESLGAVKISAETAEVLRIENGIPKYGVDVDDTTVVLETGIDEAVSFNKGCYIGQEIIARIHFRGHVAKRLSGLVLEENAEIAPNDELKSPEGKAAGRITSTDFSPALNKRIALGLVRYEFLAPGTNLRVISNDKDFAAKVVELPFIK